MDFQNIKSVVEFIETLMGIMTYLGAFAMLVHSTFNENLPPWLLKKNYFTILYKANYSLSVQLLDMRRRVPWQLRPVLMPS